MIHSTLSTVCLGCPQTGEKSAKRREVLFRSRSSLDSPPGAQQQSEGGKTAPGPAHKSSEGADLEEEAPVQATPLEEVGPLIIAPVPCRIHLQQLAADSRC